MRMKTRVFDVRTKAALAKALPEVVQVLKSGGILIFPTDTVYGLGGNALDGLVIKKIYAVKKRNAHKSFLINVASARQLKSVVRNRPRAARELEKKFWPGALSLVYEASEALPHWLSGKEKKIGVRIPNHPVALALLRKFGTPLVSTSANFSGKRAPISAEELFRLFSGKVDIILDASSCTGQPSTIVDITTNPPTVLREGAIPAKAIYKALQNI